MTDRECGFVRPAHEYSSRDDLDSFLNDGMRLINWL